MKSALNLLLKYWHKGKSDKNMLLQKEDQYSFEKEIPEMGKSSNNDDIKLYLDDIVEDVDVVGDLEVDINLFRSLYSNHNDLDATNSIESNNKNECGLNDLPSQKEIENNHTNCLNRQLQICQGQSTLSKNFVAQNTSGCQVQKTSIDTFESNNNNNYPVNPKVVLERLSVSSVKQKLKIKVTNDKASSIKIEKARYHCSDCHFKTDKRKKMISHLDDTSHDSIYYKKQLISNGNFYSGNRSKINNEHKIKSKLHYQLRNKYSNKSFCCSFNKCHFTVKNWKLMYYHVKFAHLQIYKLKKNKNKHRIKDIPKHVYRNNKLEMRTLIILERLPLYIVNSESPVPIKLWFPYSRGIILKELPPNPTRKVISTVKKYPCAFANCMFVCKNWKAMHRHVKFYHVKLIKSHVKVIKCDKSESLDEQYVITKCENRV